MFEEIIKLLKKRKGYFYNFYRAAEKKKNIGKSRQYRIEKWIQAELVNYLWEHEQEAIPEYRFTEEGKFWDIYIEAEKGTENLVLIKSYVESAQYPSGEAKAIKDDLEEIIRSTDKKCAFLLLLPWGKNEYKGRKEHAKKVLEKIKDQISGLRERIPDGNLGGKEKKIFLDERNEIGVLVKYWEFEPRNV